MSYLFVALGGGLGAMLRFFVNQLVPFPFGTMSVNVIGSFLMGIAFILIGANVGSKEVMFLMTGLLGGFTTFSAFSLDALKLWEAGKSGFAIGYVMLSVFLSIMALWAGIMLIRGGNA